MEDRLNLILTSVICIVQDFVDTSSSESDDNEEEVVTVKRQVPRVLNYVEETVPRFTDKEFKGNFR